MIFWPKHAKIYAMTYTIHMTMWFQLFFIFISEHIQGNTPGLPML